MNDLHQGTESCYASGCRRPECREAHRVKQAARRRCIAYGTHRPRHVSTVGVRRRVQALATQGWTAVAIGAQLGVSTARIHAIMQQRSVTRDVAGRIAAVYDQLWDVPAPNRTRGERITAARARRQAGRNGWHPPLAWDDDEIDDPNAQPRTPPNGEWEHKPCGTLAAYRRHLRRGERIDEACRLANVRREDAA